MDRSATVDRKTKETDIKIEINIDGKGDTKISTGVPFFDHMLKLFAVHGFFDLNIEATGDIEVDFHHTVEDVGIVLGMVFDKALKDKKGITRYGFAVTPMDDALANVSIDLSNRPYLVYNLPKITSKAEGFDIFLAKEFFRAFSTWCKMNLHIQVLYGENEHHIIESIFKSMGRAMDLATSFDKRISGVRSSKGSI
ncbi:MAG: imidazoleglycerol-phosphate dehydratase HisB [Deltaproteobacteria bacterium]|nr:imidazoleglycerol-phosphate dehydratase HisB [Deltaproteobacteria bacterium]